MFTPRWRDRAQLVRADIAQQIRGLEFEAKRADPYHKVQIERDINELRALLKQAR